MGSSLRPAAKARVRLACAGSMVLAFATGAQANGFTTGTQFAVTEGGAATITLPIQVPRGIAGMEPQLSLTYSSGAGNGLFGYGWTLTGPSMVTRCPQTRLHDGVLGKVNFDSGDRYCLDGARLLVTSGTGYHPGAGADRSYVLEKDTFSRITARGAADTATTGAPERFTVETKSGLRMEFGRDANGRAATKMVSGSGDTVSRWYLQRIADRMATPNYVEFVYCGGTVSLDGRTCVEPIAAYTGSKVLWYIRYTNRGEPAAGTSAVVFAYEARPDRRISYFSGSLLVQKQRVATISTYVGFASPTSPGTRVKTYELTYEALEEGTTSRRATNISRLTRVQELRGSPTKALTRPPRLDWDATDALPPLDFIYPTDSIHGKTVPQSASGAAGTNTTHTGCGGYMPKYRGPDLCP